MVSGVTVPIWFTLIAGGATLLNAAVATWNSQGGPGTIGPIGKLVFGVLGAGLILLGTWLWYTGRRD